MNGSFPDFADLLSRWHRGVAAIFHSADARSSGAERLVELLAELTPQASLTACLLRDGGTARFALRAARAGRAHERENLLKSQLSSLDSSTAGVRRLPSDTLPGHRVLAAAIHGNAHSRGALALGFSTRAAREATERAEALLSAAAPAVALYEAAALLESERAELARFALLGQAFAGLAHDLNNALNSMMLQTSVVQLRSDPQTQQELAAVRQHGALAAGLVRALQHVVHERRERSYPVDLNDAITEALEEDATLRRRVAPKLSADARIQGTRGALKQLIHLLLEGVCAGTEAAVSAATATREDEVVLTLTVPDAVSADGADAADSMLWRNLDDIGRRAGQSLLRQLGGVLTVEGGACLRVAWKSA